MNNMKKKPEEILNIMKAASIGDMCFSHIIEYIRPGMTELEIAGEIERTLYSLGAEGLAFPTICVSGVNTTQPHGEPSSKQVQEGEFITMDFGAVYRGYCGDMTRTVAVGHIGEKEQEVYDTVLRAQEAAIAACKAGVSCKKIDSIARDIITEKGYGEYYVHGTGHGVGTEVHETPYLNQKSEDTLEENMAITIEPGIYIPDEFGVRIEDLAIVTEFGIINTVKSQKSLLILK